MSNTTNIRIDRNKRRERAGVWGRLTAQLEREVRASGMTMRELSRVSGVPVSSISRFLDGGELSGRSIDAIAAALNLEIAKRGA